MRQGGAENLKIDDHQGVESLAGLVIGGADLIRVDPVTSPKRAPRKRSTPSERRCYENPSRNQTERRNIGASPRARPAFLARAYPAHPAVCGSCLGGAVDAADPFLSGTGALARRTSRRG